MISSTPCKKLQEAKKGNPSHPVPYPSSANNAERFVKNKLVKRTDLKIIIAMLWNYFFAGRWLPSGCVVVFPNWGLGERGRFVVGKGGDWTRNLEAGGEWPHKRERFLGQSWIKRKE
jgi:hypothetical protein